jgi:hypothetical protein
MKRDIFNAVVAKDARRLAASLLAMPGVSDIFFNPLDLDCPDTTFAGNLIRLCTSVCWHDGLRSCRDFGIDPNRNSCVCDPFLSAFWNDDVESAGILISMGADPLMPFPDDRASGLTRYRQHLLTPEKARQYRNDPRFGELDHLTLSRFLAERPFTYMRPKLGCLLLNDPRPNSLEIFQSLTAGNDAAKDEDVRLFAQFFYHEALYCRKPETARAIRDMFGIEPDLDIVTDRCPNYASLSPRRI